jgi:CRISPR-associated endonuclease Csn1
MKKILGLDLGVTSIGWAFIKEDEKQNEIIGLGSRIIQLSVDEKDEFAQGLTATKNQQRTLKRTLRKGMDRYQLRKTDLRNALSRESVNMLPEKELFGLSALELYGLRDKAVKEKIELKELGRIWLHLNQKRGYKSSRKDDSADKKITDYEQKIVGRHKEIVDLGLTVGQYFYEELKKDSLFRIKEKVFPRVAYFEEFNKVWEEQKKHYPKLLTDEFKKEIRDEIIFYQRPLKSQKDLVSVCEFESKWYKNKEGKDIYSGPKVAPKSSPLFQLAKIWESANNITIKNKRGEKFEISNAKQKEIVEHLEKNDKLSEAELFKMLGIGKNDGYYSDALTRKKGLQGNLTKFALAQAIGANKELQKWLQFDIAVTEKETTDTTSGEMTMVKEADATFEQQPLYQLWHVIYSIADDEQLLNTLLNKFAIPEETAKALSKIDFTKGGFGNKSAKAIRKILPHLILGAKYSDACTIAGYNHSNSLTTEQNQARKLLDQLPQIKKNALRQPIVEKILNQLVNVINAILADPRYGKPDEIRIELARELKQSRDERNDAYKRNNDQDKRHKAIEKELLTHPEFQKKKVSRRDIERYKLWEEFGGCSPYEPTKHISLGALFSGSYDIEHIIPKSRLFDDSFSNKTICPRHLNSGEFAKNQQTAFDFMKQKDGDTFERYLNCIDTAYKRTDNRLSKSKRDKMLMSVNDIPQDFIARQLRETQYIARKAREVLMQVCTDVHATSGSVTDYLRHEWGWDDVTMNLQLPKYKAIEGLTELKEINHNGQKHQKEVIVGWSKRDDHRHHAIDALVIASTKQGIINRLNKLNQIAETKKDLSRKEDLKEKGGEGLRQFVSELKPFTTAQVTKAAESVFISFKPGKRVATYGKRVIDKGGKKETVQTKIIVPRGALSEESVYGKIKQQVISEVKLSPSFKNVEKIAHKRMREIIEQRLSEYDNDPAKAFKGLAKNPIWADAEKTKEITTVAIANEVNEHVIKYPIQSITTKDVDSIVDGKVKEVIKKRLEAHGGNHKEAFKDLEKNPVWMNEAKRIQVKSVRCFTGLGKLEALHCSVDGVTYPLSKKDEFPNAELVDFVKSGNNHHLSVFEDEQGKLYDTMTTFQEAVARKMQGVSFIVKEHEQGYKFLMSLQQNEMVVYKLKSSEINFKDPKNRSLISQHLYRVQKMSKKASGETDIWFRHHLETKYVDDENAKKSMRYLNIRSISKIREFTKIRVNNLGEITKVGE